MDFEVARISVDESYWRRVRDTEEVWRGYEKEVEELTGRVSADFGVLVEKVYDGPREEYWEGWNISEWDVEYKHFNPEDGTTLPGKIHIRITGVENGQGENIESNFGENDLYGIWDFLKRVCGFRDNLDSKVIEFMEKYDIYGINIPRGTRVPK